MQDKSAIKLAGEVEVGESFIGGKSRNMRKEKRARFITGRPDKAIALGGLRVAGKQRVSVFRNGQWWLDINDHIWDSVHDQVFDFGQTRDIPVIADCT
jgi:hypothetical protein